MLQEGARTPDTEIVLSENGLHLRVSPFGASLRGLWRESAEGESQEIITAYTGAKGKVGGQGDVLIPFPGRVRDGKYTFSGTTYQMVQNDKDGPNAIHGFLRLKLWEIKAQSATQAVFFTVLSPDDAPGYPFALHVTVTYQLESDGLTCHFTIENVGQDPAPVASGFHPYFTVGSALIDTDILTVPFAATLEFANLLPTGSIVPVDGTAFDFREPRPIQEVKFNTCYLNPLRDADGKLEVRLTNADNTRTVAIWLGDGFDYLVLYSGDPLPETHRRRALAIEPMTCAADGFNHPEWGLKTLAPGAAFTGSWGVRI